MRPLELSLRGFRSYREPVTFDWRGRRLVGVVGPIGSGKSSLLDAVAFSLFGKTPTFDRDTKSLIHQLSEECHVELRFEVDGQIWRAARGLRRKGASGHQLQRLAHDAPDAEVLESIVGEKAMRERVERLLGMAFDAFCRSVLLAQNRFSEFLRATPAQRNEVLKGVFGYERFDAAYGAAKLRLADAERAAASLDEEGGRLSTTREQLATASAELTSATARADGLRSARVKMDEVAESRRLAEEQVARALESQRQLEDIAGSLPDLERADAVFDASTRADEALDHAQVGAAQAEADHAVAEAAYAAVVERIGDQARFAALVRSMEHLTDTAEERTKRRDELAAALSHAVEVAREADDGARSAMARRDAAGKEWKVAEARVQVEEERAHAARHADMAMVLRATLDEGAPCPVCEQPVTTPPKVASIRTLEAAEETLEEARQLAEQLGTAAGSAAADAAAAQERSAAAVENVGRIEAELARADEALRTAEAELDATKSELVDHLGAGDPHELLATRAAELEGAGQERDRTAEAAAEARAGVERVRSANLAAGSALTRLSTELAAAWGRLGRSHGASEGVEALREEFSALREGVRERQEHVMRQRSEAAAGVAQATDTAAALHAELGIEPEADFVTVLAEAAAQEATSRERVVGLQTVLATGADLDARVAAVQRHLELTRRLAADLQPAKFLAFLLEEERAALGDLGSVHLEELTDRAYRFTGDARFDVVDLNAAGSVRRADSLSGGETFLASLALALALAEMVARGGGRLDAFFLDEGFGSLDPEHLDRAMEGIGRLVAGPIGSDPSAQRLVVLVSHVEQMRQMVEDLIVLDKDAITGDTIVRSGAGPAYPATPV